MIKENSVVSIHYRLSNSAGELLDSSEGQEPLSYIAGAGNIIIGLDTALIGKTLGDAIDVTVPAADAYGEVNPDLIQQVPRTSFQDVDDLAVGMQFEAQGAEGSLVVVITEIADDYVVVDANHPLAGQELSFAVTVESVRDATESEIEAGAVAN